MSINYKQDTHNVNWEALRQSLIEDDFHNGRTTDQYRLSFQNSSAVVIAYDGDTIIGTVRMLSDGVCNAYIIDVWTRSAYRRQGIARHMLQLVEEKAVGQHISLWTDSAQTFYEQCDYQPSEDFLYEKVVGSWLQSDQR